MTAPDLVRRAATVACRTSTTAPPHLRTAATHAVRLTSAAGLRLQGLVSRYGKTALRTGTPDSSTVTAASPKTQRRYEYVTRHSIRPQFTAHAARPRDLRGPSTLPLICRIFPLTSGARLPLTNFQQQLPPCPIRLELSAQPRRGVRRKTSHSAPTGAELGPGCHVFDHGGGARRQDHSFLCVTAVPSFDRKHLPGCDRKKCLNEGSLSASRRWVA